MKKDIYIVINKVNGKCYIGQSIDYRKRFNDHIRYAKSGKNTCKMYEEIRKYGESNFEVEVLESQIYNYDEREMYWISKLNTLVPNGYNVSHGGKGYAKNTSRYTSEDDVNTIIDLLKNSNMSIVDISKHLGLPWALVEDINIGASYKRDNIEYPIRNGFKLNNGALYDLIDDLKYSSMSYQEIADKYGVSKVHVKAINYGFTYKNEEYEYPIRKEMKFHYILKDVLLDIIDDIKNTDLVFGEIAKKYGCSFGTVRRINSGVMYHVDGEKYPLRPIKELSQEQLGDIEKYLKSTGLTYEEIAKIYDVSPSTIKRIDFGVTKKYRKESVNYPIRK